MIFLKIVVGLILLPLTLLIAILFNIYIVNRFYFIGMILLALIYALLFAFLLNNINIVVWIFIPLSLLYMMRMTYLSYHLAKNNWVKNYPILRGKIKSKNSKFNLKLLFPLSFLGIFKLLPHCISQKITKKIGHEIEVSQFIDHILISSVGTKIEIINDEINICFEIQ